MSEKGDKETQFFKNYTYYLVPGQVPAQFAIWHDNRSRRVCVALGLALHLPTLFLPSLRLETRIISRGL